MQIYLDLETVEFLKDYAKREGKSFAEVVRMSLHQSKEQLKPAILTSQNKKVQAFDRIMHKAGKIKNVRYEYPDVSDDELLYAYDKPRTHRR